MLFGTVPVAYAANNPTLDPGVSIAIDGTVCQPTDADGNPVYPILYEGATYIPVLGLSYLFGKAANWNSKTHTLLISDNKVKAPTFKPANKPKAVTLSGVRPDKGITIRYKGKVKKFTDTNGKALYPISYKNTIYIPVDGAASLFGKVAGWDGSSRRVLINSPAMSVKSIRVVVDGKVNTFDAKLFGGDWYLKPADIKAALGVKVTATLDGYANLRDAARKADVSYEHDGVLNAAYIWTDETYANANGDFARAVSLGLVPNNLKTDTGRQITAKEFRVLLSDIVGKLVPDKIKQFNNNVSTYNKPLLRGEGFVMAYYAAACVGADTWNNSFDNSRADGGDFWDTSIFEMDKLFPNINDGPVTFTNDSNEWDNYFIAAFLWSFWHSSPFSNKQVFEFDESVGSMRTKEPLTVKEAVSAAVRIYDSYSNPQNVSLTDAKAVNYDKMIITDKLLNKANALPTIKKENIPVWKGFVFGDVYGRADIIGSDQDLRNIADWGFNSVRTMFSYRTLFDDNVHSVNVSNLKKLDALIAAAMKYNLHIDILTFGLPGRWTSTDFNTFQTIGSFDLFTNPDRQKEANAVWALLSERYKDIPSATLSFCPIWEAQNYNLSSGLPVDPYTPEDVAKVYSQLIATIREHDPDRFIIFEPTANNDAEYSIKESRIIKDTIESKYSDVLMMANFCETPFVYAEMTAVAGDNIDNNNHSMFKPAYPTTIYAAQFHIDNGSTLDMDGELVAGTKIDIYLSKVDGTGDFNITADGKTLYSKSLSTRNFNVEAPLSGYYPYAKSDKLISITLPSDVEKLQIGYGGNWFEWSGIDVTLPKKYAVKRWWFMSGYDAMLGGVEQTRPTLKDTSTVMISPNSYNSGRTITINADVTYTSPEIFAQSNKQTIENWAKAMSEFSPNLTVRFENAGFNIGCIHDSALKYYDDLLSAFAKYGIGWFSNDYWSMTHGGNSYAGIKSVQYKDFSLDVDMLKLLQRYQ
jgi:hypothetical protein